MHLVPWSDDYVPMQILKTMGDAGIKPGVIAYTTAMKVKGFSVKISLFYFMKLLVHL